MNRIKELFTRPLETSGSTHGSLLVVVGGYLIYLAYQMWHNVQTGQTSMSLRTTLILMACMILAGVAVLAYGGVMVYRSARAARESAEKDQSITSKEEKP